GRLRGMGGRSRRPPEPPAPVPRRAPPHPRLPHRPLKSSGPPEVDVHRVLRGRDRPGGHDMDDLDAGLREETPHIGLWIDTSDQPPDQTVDEIVARGMAEGSIS